LRRIERPRYGYYLDNSVACVAKLLLAFGVGLSGYVRFDLCLFALVAYLMVSVLSFIRADERPHSCDEYSKSGAQREELTSGVRVPLLALLVQRYRTNGPALAAGHIAPRDCKPTCGKLRLSYARRWLGRPGGGRGDAIGYAAGGFSQVFSVFPCNGRKMSGEGRLGR
jgi:hypothetical protein